MLEIFGSLHSDSEQPKSMPTKLSYFLGVVWSKSVTSGGLNDNKALLLKW